MQHPNWKAFFPQQGPRAGSDESPAAAPFALHDKQVLAESPYAMHLDTLETKAGERFAYLYRPLGAQVVHVLPVLASGELLLIRQYRWPLRRHITEVVAGGIEAGETPQDAAARELLEEAGGTAKGFLPLPAFYPQAGVSGAAAFPLLALGVTLGEAKPEAGELIERLPLPAREVYRRLSAGEIESGGSALTLYAAKSHLEGMGLL